MAQRRRVPPWLTRDLVLFIFGLAGIVYETVFDSSDKPTLLILFGAMVGLPAFLHTDEARRKRSPDASEKDKSATP